ncbi:MAG: shikimate dehydrogenase family protein [Bacillota bacterium]
MVELPQKAEKPTMYFIGVTTTQSSINDLFPEWAEVMNLDARLVGIDMEIHADPEEYREVVEFIKNDELSYGALVTTHKIDPLNACEDMFDYLDPHARVQGELSCIAKKGGKLEGYAKDPITSGLAMEAFVPDNFWKEHRGEVFIMGAGGSARAMSSYLLTEKEKDNRPARIVISNRSKPRLEKIEGIIDELNDGGVDADFHLTPEHEDNDRVLETIKPYSLIVNATGLGKDRPGSPLTDGCQFPENSLIWEINYRGDLRFMHQALEQKEEKNLHVEDGWIYFIHGWTQVIIEIFDIELDEETFNEIERVATEFRKNR